METQPLTPRVSLDAYQLEVVDCPALRIVVAAGPGSGKTGVLTERIHGLVDRGMSPGRIVAVTYTNSAAGEIARRLRPGLKLGHLGTIHSWALKLLRDFGERAGLPKRFTVIDEVQEALELDRSAREMRYKGSKALLREAAEWPSRTEGYSGEHAKLAHDVVEDARRRMMRGGMLTYGMVLRAGITMAATLAEVGESVADALLVDEYQDCGTATHVLCQTAKCGSKFFVGDPDQAVMAFAGGNPSAFLSLWNAPDSQRFGLESNYRSGVDICTLASHLIRHNKKRVAKLCTAVYEDEPGAVEWWRPDTEGAEAAMIAVNAQRKGHGSFAVLARTNWITDQVAQRLRDHCVPVAADTRQQQPEGWQVARAVVGFLADPERDAAALWLLECQRGREEAARMAREAGEAFQTINQAFLRVEAGLPPESAADAVFRMTKSQETARRVAQIALGLPPGSCMEDLALAMSYPEPAKTSTDGVWVGTIHRAKGLEWDHVVLVGAEEGVLPSDAKDADLEEERRLCFVAITRARKWVAVSSCDSRRLNKWANDVTAKKLEPSRFVEEMKGGAL